MSVLFKSMEIPGDCRDCPFNMFYNNCGETRCRANNEILAVDYMAIPFSGRPDWCPIIELPPHGRLIDADDFFRSFPELIPYEFAAPTIIPAEEGET